MQDVDGGNQEPREPIEPIVRLIGRVYLNGWILRARLKRLLLFPIRIISLFPGFKYSLDSQDCHQDR